MAGLREWGGVTYGVLGDATVKATLGFYATSMPAIAGEAWGEVAGEELREAQRRAPIDTDPRPGERGGELRESGRLVGPVAGDQGIEVAIAFGGQDQGVRYAIAQHQKYYTHEEGSREYLIDTLDKSKRFLAARAVRKIQARMGQARTA